MPGIDPRKYRAAMGNVARVASSVKIRGKKEGKVGRETFIGCATIIINLFSVRIPGNDRIEIETHRRAFALLRCALERCRPRTTVPQVELVNSSVHAEYTLQ